MNAEQYAQALREAGLRVTAPRIATLGVVSENPHADADTVWEAVRSRLGSVSRQAVYDVLRALTEASLLRRVHLDGRGARFELQLHDNHHHMVCRSCGRFEDVPCVTGSAPCLYPDDTGEFTVEVAEVLYRGLCDECRASQSDAPQPVASQ